MDLKYKSKTYIEQGLTNDNYLLVLEDNSKIVYRKPKKHNIKFDYNNEKNIIDLIKPLNIGPNELYFNPETGEKISSYIENTKYFNNHNYHHLKEIAITLKKLHSLQVNIEFKMFDKLNEYKGNEKSIFLFEENIINSLIKYQSHDKQVLCHNDLVKGNLLFSDKFYLIDYEYASNNYLEFDLASLLSENNIESNKTIIYFLKEYYGHEINEDLFKKVMTYYVFEDILWSYWALNFYKLYQKPIYKKILKQKYNRANKFYNLYIKKED